MSGTRKNRIECARKRRHQIRNPEPETLNKPETDNGIDASNEESLFDGEKNVLNVNGGTFQCRRLPTTTLTTLAIGFTVYQKHQFGHGATTLRRLLKPQHDFGRRSKTT